jgi:hypothetical protein
MPLSVYSAIICFWIKLSIEKPLPWNVATAVSATVPAVLITAPLSISTQNQSGKRLPDSGDSVTTRARGRGGLGCWDESRDAISRSSARIWPTAAITASGRFGLSAGRGAGSGLGACVRAGVDCGTFAGGCGRRCPSSAWRAPEMVYPSPWTSRLISSAISTSRRR